MPQSPEAKGLGLECVFTRRQAAEIQREARRVVYRGREKQEGQLKQGLGQNFT